MTPPPADRADGGARANPDGRITRDVVLAAALELIDRDGVDGLSMRRLARVLHAYERALSSREVDLLVRFCIFRSGASIETLHSIFTRTDAPNLCGDLAGCAEDEFRRIVTRLARLHQIDQAPGPRARCRIQHGTR